jgi:hypothetical protein
VSLIAASDNPWVGLLFMVVFVAMGGGCFYLGHCAGQRVNSPTFVKSVVASAQQALIDRKENYKRLCVRYYNRINSAIALVHNLHIQSPSPELEKVEKVLRGFDKLAAHGNELSNLTPEHEVDISKLIGSKREDEGKDARLI